MTELHPQACRRRAEVRPNAAAALRFESIDDLSSRYDGRRAVIEVMVHGTPVDIVVKPTEGSRRAFVSFNSQQKAGAPLRLFTWTAVTENLRGHRIYIADPTLYGTESVLVGWYLATRNGNFQQALHHVIEVLLSALNADEVAFFGSSGGGFPAVYYSQQFSHSLALTLAPTLTVANREKRAWLPWLEQSMSMTSLDEVLGAYPDLVLDLPTWVDSPLRNPVHALLSSGDQAFIDHSITPMCIRLGIQQSMPSDVDANGLHLRFGQWGTQHTPPPSDVVAQALTLLSDSTDWRTFRLPPAADLATAPAAEVGP